MWKNNVLLQKWIFVKNAYLGMYLWLNTTRPHGFS